MNGFNVSEMISAGRPLVMGILNVTPDSFSDGGKYSDIDTAIEHALEMIDYGADIIDIGGESSRPNAVPVSETDELERVIPVIRSLSAITAIPISIDTYKAVVARQALDAGASIVNDISALRFDNEMPAVIREHGASAVLMHMQGNPGTMQQNPQYENVVDDIIVFLRERADYAVEQGITKDKIIVDPGIGFGKNLNHNIDILRNIVTFLSLGYPVLVGASRKRMIGEIAGNTTSSRMMGTAAIVAHCVLNGVAIHRLHDVKEMRQVCDVAAAIRG